MNRSAVRLSFSTLVGVMALTGCTASHGAPSSAPSPAAGSTARAVVATEPNCSGEASDTTVYTSDEVHASAKILVSPKPRYPADLRKQGVSGRVTLTYIINGTGLVDSASVDVSSATNAGFAASARDAVLGMRFSPACRGTAPVRVRVQQAIIFDVTRDGDEHR